jgi:formamidopyrimidine-DNA glycosylase
MPELPEVEVTRRGIAGPLFGARVLSARLGKPLRWPLGRAPATLAGCTVGEVSRRGKYLFAPHRRSRLSCRRPAPAQT